ncbi:hypothetical protein KP509_02G063700 [Ceratopteris richardii]|uniref:PLATZ transcription factor family protein n=1 Tax=Ceratopteris richardii TaxID=49495 RepID=A0A8T2V9M1_CERRI|nr:hypothetical protein KP509_02G063700 [Ceratopteris richardii]
MATCSPSRPVRSVNFDPPGLSHVDSVAEFHPAHNSREGPPWLENFLSCSYFDPCTQHQFNKNEKNHFCIDCNEGPLCSRGLASSHSKHRTLQVRKASHADGVRVENISKLLDISGIQTYIINNHRIVFLLRQAKGKLAAKLDGTSTVSRHCQICGRLLSDLVKFCSIKCKLLGIRRQQEVGDPASLSLSLETRTAHYPTAFNQIDKWKREPTSYSDHFHDDAARIAREDYSCERELEVTLNMEYRGLKSSILSPMSVLDRDKAYTVTGLSPLKNVDSLTYRKLLNGCMYNGTQAAKTANDQSNEEKMRLELALIQKLLSSGRRKRRKSLPQRAPLS